jgi:hypothetical protein
VTAEALDLMHLPERPKNNPKTTVVSIFVTDMKVPRTSGGHWRLDECMREKRLVQVVAESCNVLLSCVKDVLSALQVDDQSKDYQPCYRESETQKMSKTVAERVKKWEDRRRAVGRKPLNGTETNIMIMRRRGMLKD